jgi:hypothetical protein
MKATHVENRLVLRQAGLAEAVAGSCRHGTWKPARIAQRSTSKHNSKNMVDLPARTRSSNASTC